MADALSDSGFLFSIHIDNRLCAALRDGNQMNTVAVAKKLGKIGKIQREARHRDGVWGDLNPIDRAINLEAEFFPVWQGGLL